MNVEESQYYALVTRTKASIYHFKCNKNNSIDQQRKTIGLFERRLDGDKVICYDTARIALSPIMSEEMDIKFHLYFFDKTSLAIDIWKYSIHNSDYSYVYLGNLEVLGLEKQSSLAGESSGVDFRKIHGNVSFCNLYISCPTLSLVRCIQLPYATVPTDEYQVQSVHNVKHENLKCPMALAVARKEEETSLAVLSGLCGRVFLFTKNEFRPFQLVTIFASNLLLPSSTLRFDSFLNVWASDFGRGKLVCYANNGGNNEKVVETHNQVTGVHPSSNGLIFGWNSKSNCVGMVTTNESRKLFLNTVFGPSTVFRPVDLATSSDAGVIVVAGRSSTNNIPVISVLRFQTK